MISASTVKSTATGGSSRTLDLSVTLDREVIQFRKLSLLVTVHGSGVTFQKTTGELQISFLLSGLIQVICVLCLKMCRRDSLFAWWGRAHLAF